jgi:hypothetical protein
MSGPSLRMDESLTVANTSKTLCARILANGRTRKAGMVKAL